MCLETRSAEALFVKPGNDRCTVVFALNFPDETDNAIARVMLQQFAKESSKVRKGLGVHAAAAFARGSLSAQLVEPSLWAAEAHHCLAL
jgi:hypothetical protein